MREKLKKTSETRAGIFPSPTNLHVLAHAHPLSCLGFFFFLSHFVISLSMFVLDGKGGGGEE